MIATGILVKYFHQVPSVLTFFFYSSQFSPEIHVLFVSYNPRLWSIFYVCLVHLSRKSVGSRHVSRTAGRRGPKKWPKIFSTRGEKSWWWIRLDSRSGYFDKSRFVRRIDEDFCRERSAFSPLNISSRTASSRTLYM